jgi:branched-chain amino acid transport system ATP-binding protein
MRRSSRRISAVTVSMLDVSNVSMSYRRIPAVHAVSLTVAAGEVVALLGSNGAGKSTLLRTIAGVLHPDAGRITFDGTDITRLATHRIARLGLRLVPDGRGLLRRMTVRQNLQMGQHPRRPRDRAARSRASAARHRRARLSPFPC